MSEYEDAIQRLRDKGREDEADFFAKFANSTLMRKAQRVKELELENEAIQARLLAVERAGPIEEALRAVGVDVAALRPAERQMLAGVPFAEGTTEPDEDWVAEVVSKYGLPLSKGPSPDLAGCLGGPLVGP